MDKAEAIRIFESCDVPYIEDYPEITWRYVARGLSENGRELNNELLSEFQSIDDAHKVALAREIVGAEHHCGLLVLIDSMK